MAETPSQTAKRRALERRSLTGAGAREVAAEQESALRRGYSSHPMPAPRMRPLTAPDEPLRPRQDAPGPLSAADLGGAKDDPNLEITVGPTGEIVRRRKE